MRFFIVPVLFAVVLASGCGFTREANKVSAEGSLKFKLPIPGLDSIIEVSGKVGVEHGISHSEQPEPKKVAPLPGTGGGTIASDELFPRDL